MDEFDLLKYIIRFAHNEKTVMQTQILARGLIYANDRRCAMPRRVNCACLNCPCDQKNFSFAEQSSIIYEP
jgi:hypothetical protein